MLNDPKSTHDHDDEDDDAAGPIEKEEEEACSAGGQGGETIEDCIIDVGGGETSSTMTSTTTMTPQPVVTWCWEESYHKMDRHNPDEIFVVPAEDNNSSGGGGGGGSCWIKYSSHNNGTQLAIETSYQRQYKGLGIYKIQQHVHGSHHQCYEIDFQNFQQINLNTGFRRKVQRFVHCPIVRSRESQGFCGICGGTGGGTGGGGSGDRCLICFPYGDKEDFDLTVDALCRGDRNLLNKIPDKIKNNKERVIIRALSKHGLALKYLVAKWKNDTEVVKVAIQQNGTAIKYASTQLRNDPDVVLLAIANSINGWGLSTILQSTTSPSIKENRSFMKQAVQINPLIFRHLSPKFQNDKEIVLLAVQKKPTILFEYVSERLQNDHDVRKLCCGSNNNNASSTTSKPTTDSDEKKNNQYCSSDDDDEDDDTDFSQQQQQQQQASSTATTRGRQLLFCGNQITKQYGEYPEREGIPKYLRNDRAYVLSQVKFDGHLLSYVSERLCNDKDVVQQAIQHTPMALVHASIALRDDKDIAIQAVSLRGSSIRYVSDRLRADKDIALAAVTNMPGMLFRCSKELWNDKDVILAAVRNQGNMLLQLSSLSSSSSSAFCVQDDRDVVLAAVSNNGDALRYASNRLRDDESIVLAAVTQNGNSLQHASKEIRGNKQCVMAAVQQKPESLKYALGGLNQDRDCLIAAGLWDQSHDNNNATASSPSRSRSPHLPLHTTTEQQQQQHQQLEELVVDDGTQTSHWRNKKDSPKIVLSTRFSLDEESSTTATEFTVLLKEHSYVKYEKEFIVYSPNAFGKNTCDPEWTRQNWPCRGTPTTCKKISVDQETKTPTTDCCWRYSYRHQLQLAKENGGFMLQVVELAAAPKQQGNGPGGGGGGVRPAGVGEHKLGDGQMIEVLMAKEVGIKLFRIFEPIVHLKIGKGVRWRRPFLPNDIDALVSRIKEWYEVSPNDDMSVVEVHCERRSSWLGTQMQITEETPAE